MIVFYDLLGLYSVLMSKSKSWTRQVVAAEIKYVFIMDIIWLFLPFRFLFFE